MKNSLIVLLMMTSSLVVAAPKEFTSGADLRDQLIQLYDSSRTPYPVEQQVLSDTTKSNFQGCAHVTKDGVVHIDESEHLFVKYRTLVTRAAGPLIPATYTYYTNLIDRDSLNSFLRNGAEFKDGFVDFSKYPFANGKSPKCSDDTSYRKLWLNTETKVNQAGTDYVYEVSCNDGTVISQIKTRKSGEYLVFKLLNDSYGYCWR